MVTVLVLTTNPEHYRSFKAQLESEPGVRTEHFSDPHEALKALIRRETCYSEVILWGLRETPEDAVQTLARKRPR